MTFETVMIIICAVLLLGSNIVLLVLNLKKKKQESGINMDTEDYLILIMKQIEQIACDAISLVSIDKDDYESVDDYTLALTKETKRLLLEDAESYGINPKFLELIKESTLEKYVCDAVKNVMLSITREDEGLGDTIETEYYNEEDSETPELSDDTSDNEMEEEPSLEVIEPAPESAYDTERNLIKAMNSFYSDSENE